MTPDGEPLVVIRGVHKTYEPSPFWLRMLLRSAISESVTALTDINLEVRRGEILAVVGPNGAGKSTLFRILTGLTTPTEGSAEICGYDCATEATKARRLLGFMPAEDRTLFLRYSCYENLLFHGRMQGIPAKVVGPRIEEMLELVDLSSARDTAGFALSSGMRSRLQLARALLAEPPVLILDEPTGPVDPVSAHSFLTTLQTVTSEKGVAVLLSSHRLEEIEALRESVVLLNEGRVVFRGDLENLRSITERPLFRIEFTEPAHASEAMRLLESHPTADTVTVADNDSALHVATSGHAGAVLSALGSHSAHVTSLVQARMPLRDLFMHVLDGQGQTRETA